MENYNIDILLLKISKFANINIIIIYNRDHTIILSGIN